MIDSVEEVSSPKGTVGQQLRAAREETGRDLADIAHEMHMKVAQLEKLEADDYERLPDTVFVLGYIRTFSRLVNLDSSPLVEQFTRERPVKEPPPHSVSIDEAIDYEPRARTGLLTLMLVVLSALLVAAAVILLRGGNPIEGIISGSSIDSNESGDEIAVDSAEVSKPQTGGWLSIQSSEEASDLLTPAVKEPVLTYEGEGLGQVISLPKITGEPDGIKEKEPVLPKITLPPKVTEKVKPTAPKVKENETDAPPVAKVVDVPVKKKAPQVSSTAIFINEEPVTGVPMTVIMEFSEDSWVKVSDVYNESLLSGLKPAGTEETLKGDGPFNVFLGNGMGVIITVEGTPYDFSEKIRSNRTARFTLSK